MSFKMRMFYELLGITLWEETLDKSHTFKLSVWRERPSHTICTNPVFLGQAFLGFDVCWLYPCHGYFDVSYCEICPDCRLNWFHGGVPSFSPLWPVFGKLVNSLPPLSPSLPSIMHHCLFLSFLFCAVSAQGTIHIGSNWKLMRYTFQILRWSALSPYNKCRRHSANKKGLGWVIFPYNFGAFSPGLVNPVPLAWLCQVSSSW